MARVVALLVVLGALVLAAGCGGSEDTTPTPETVVGEVPTGSGDGDGGGGGDVEGDPDAGKDVFASAGCGSCHTLSDAGASGTVGPSLDDSSVDFAAAVDQITNGGGGMQAFSGTLSEEEINNVAAYVVTARGR
jgi:mono/diheme cytochrome c family protein